MEEAVVANISSLFADLEKAGFGVPAGESSSSSGAHHDHAAHHHHDHAALASHDAHTGHHLMKMWFHGGYEEVILFDFWRIDSFCGLLLSCVLIFAMGAAYEGVKWFRVYLQMSLDSPHRNLSSTSKSNGHSSPSSSSNNHCHKDVKLESLMNHEGGEAEDVYMPTTTPPQPRRYSPSSTRRSLLQWAQPLLYVVQLVLAYWLMLIVMTYNSWLTAAVVLGAGFGHWLFAVLKYLNPKTEMGDSLATDACH